MRISDWSSDVCSSDLQRLGAVAVACQRHPTVVGTRRTPGDHLDQAVAIGLFAGEPDRTRQVDGHPGAGVGFFGIKPQGRVVATDRKSVVLGKSVSVRVDLGGRRILTKKKNDTIQVK